MPLVHDAADRKLGSLAGTTLVLGPIVIALGSVMFFEFPVVEVIAVGFGVLLLEGGVVPRNGSYALPTLQRHTDIGKAE